MKNYQSPTIELAGGSEGDVEINALVAPVYAVAVVVGGLYGWLLNWCGPYLD